jgi:hypothetical protein
MTETPNDDQPGFVAEEPEHCHACYRLIQPGHYHTMSVLPLPPNCIFPADETLCRQAQLNKEPSVRECPELGSLLDILRSSSSC